MNPNQLRAKLKGVVITPVVPMTDDGQVDFQGVRKMTQFLIGHGLVGRSTRAEQPCQQLDETLGVIDVRGPSGAVPGGGLKRAGERQPEAPPLGRCAVVLAGTSVVVSSAIAVSSARRACQGWRPGDEAELIAALKLSLNLE